MITSNIVPALDDGSAALVGRFIALKMHKSFFGREDPFLRDKLTAELPGILNWARDGYLRLRERGRFVQPESGRDVIEEMLELTTPVIDFVRDRCRIDPELRYEIDGLYNAFTTWCEFERIFPVPRKNLFVRDLKAAFPQLQTVRPRQDASSLHPDTKRPRYLAGIALLRADDAKPRWNF